MLVVQDHLVFLGGFEIESSGFPEINNTSQIIVICFTGEEISRQAA